MPRYVARPKANYWEYKYDRPITQTLAFEVEDFNDKSTGILDSKGNMIYRIPEEIGFYRKK